MDETDERRKAADPKKIMRKPNNLGLMYSSNGTGVEKDDRKAVQWYRRATEQNYAMAQNKLGDMSPSFITSFCGDNPRIGLQMCVLFGLLI